MPKKLKVPALLAFATMAGDALAGEATLSVQDATASQNALTFEIQRSGDTKFPIRIDYSIEPDPASANPAQPGIDYSIGATSSLTMPANATLATVIVPLPARPAGTPARSLLLKLLDARPDRLFKRDPDLAISAEPFGLGAGDLNKDGKIDLMVSNNNSASNASAFLNSGNGAAADFAAPQEVLTGLPAASAPAIFAGDLNKDGLADVVIDNNGNLTLMGNSTPPGSMTYKYTGRVRKSILNSASQIVAGDFNGDSWLDIATASDTEGTVAVLPSWNDRIQAPVMFFGNAQKFSYGTWPRGLVAADFNDDGFADLATANAATDPEQKSVSVLLNATAEGTETFAFTEKAFPQNSYPQAIGAADFDGDGKIDIVTANAQSAGVLRNLTLERSTIAVFAAVRDFNVGFAPLRALATGDINGDDLADVVVASGQIELDDTSRIFVLLNRTLPGGAIDFEVTQPYFVGGNPMQIALADFSGDGALDVAITNLWSGGAISLLVNNDAQVLTPDDTGTGLLPAVAGGGNGGDGGNGGGGSALPAQLLLLLITATLWRAGSSRWRTR